MKLTVRILLISIIVVLCASIAWKILFNPTRATVPMEVILAHDKGNLPVFHDTFIKQGEMAKKAIGIKITPVPSVSPELYLHQMKARLATELAPELFTWWSTMRAKELVDEDVTGDLTDLWDKYKNDYSKDLREAFTIGGKVYGFPYTVDYWPVWYNKTIFNRLGLEPPSTWSEFIAICKKLKAAGIPPIMASLQNDWPSFIWFEEMIIGEDPDLYKDLCLGKVKYTDPRVIKACRVWKDMIEKGYFTDPSLNILTNSGYLWNNEKFGMVLCGTWYYSTVLLAQGVKEQSIGVFIMPPHNPDAGKNIIIEMGPIFTAKHSKNSENAKKVVDWWMSPEGNGYFAFIHKSYPGNMNTDTSYLPLAKQQVRSAVQNGNYRLMTRYWESTPKPICEKAILKFGEFMLNPDTLEQILKDIDHISDNYWANSSNP